MCQLCVDAVRKHWPHLSDEEMHDLLWNATAFPFASGEHTAIQVEEMAVRSGGYLGVALALADEDIEKAMAECAAEETP